jgi:hypothetical protein
MRRKQYRVELRFAWLPAYIRDRDRWIWLKPYIRVLIWSDYLRRYRTIRTTQNPLPSFEDAARYRL